MRYRDIIEAIDAERRREANQRLRDALANGAEAQRRYEADVKSFNCSTKDIQARRTETLRRYQRAREQASKSAQAARTDLSRP